MNPTTPAQNSQQALAELQSNQAALQNPNQILESQRQNLGVQGAQDTVTGLRGAINNTTKLLKQVAPSVMGRTANSLVTNAQATRQIGNERAPLTEALGEQGGQYNEANTNLNQLEQKAGQAASGEYQGQQDKNSYLQNIYNTLYAREQEAAKAQKEELDRQEQIRQFNASLKASSGSGFNPSINNGSDANTVASGGDEQTFQQIANEVNALKNAGYQAQVDNYKGVVASAGYGNKRDQLKLQAMNAAFPGLAASVGKSGGYTTPSYQGDNRIALNAGAGLLNSPTPFSVGKGLLGSLGKAFKF